MRYALLIAASGLAIGAPTLTSANEIDALPQVLGRLFGIGRMSCAYWISTPAREAEGGNWLMGYWTGANSMNRSNHLVGAHTDGEAIIAEVRKRCVEEPSTMMVDEAAVIYERFTKQHK
jgi:hypothetical protein